MNERLLQKPARGQIQKIGVLCHHGGDKSIGHGGDVDIFGVGRQMVKNMGCIKAGFGKMPDKLLRKLGINQEAHYSAACTAECSAE